MTANPKPVELVALLRPPQPANDLLELFASTELDPSVPDHVWEAALVGPATAFLARPGKQLRAKLVATGWRLGGGSGEPPPAIARALEILHAGSLIVDDVEDRSDERRGGPALHVLIGEPLAINTGSWMYFWALEQLCALPGAVELAVRALARCHQGQALDLAARIGELAMSEVPAVVAATTRHKTGALARLATELGALAAGAGVDHRARTGDLGEATGIALQMLDDLGAIAAPERRAKAYEDLRAQRPTWPWAWLAHQGDAATWTKLTRQLRLGDHDAVAAALLARIGDPGRAAVRDVIATALEHVRFAPANLVAAITSDLHAMETMYG